MGQQLPRPLPPQRAKAVIDFLIRVANEPELKAAYGGDPDGTMKAGGLTPAERKLLINGPLPAVKHALGAGFARVMWQPPTVWQ